MNIAFVGLGQIGTPMAKRLDDPLVFDVNTAATSGFKRVAASLDELAGAEVVCVMVRDDEQVLDVVGQVLAANPAATVLVHSTIRPDTAIELAALGDVLDAPVSGGPMGAADGRLAIMVGGSDTGFARAKPVLERLGDLVVHLGPAGAGTHAKLARNLLHFVSFAAAGEAARLAEAAGIDPAVLGQIVRHSDAVTGGPGAIMWRSTTESLAEDDGWFPIMSHVRALGEKDLSLAAELATALAVDTPLAGLARQRLADELGVTDG
jgi:3-hydroxyisobutyrate dehydrogenase-like beta-hydroxyacid dehydrogenase